MFCVAVEKSESQEKTPLKLRSKNQNSTMPHVTPIAGSETGPNSEVGGECFSHFSIPSPRSLLPMASMANRIIKRNV